MLEWIPIVFVTFKVIVIGAGMFYAIKWHYDQGKKEIGKQEARRALGKVAVVFGISVLAVALITIIIMRAVGLDLTYS